MIDYQHRCPKEFVLQLYTNYVLRHIHLEFKDAPKKQKRKKAYNFINEIMLRKRVPTMETEFHGIKSNSCAKIVFKGITQMNIPTASKTLVKDRKIKIL